MRIVFWQNCLSPHQLPYIVHLMNDERVDSVVVVAGEVTHESRRKMGWDVTSFPGLECCEVYISPTQPTIEHLLKCRVEDSYHLFSGIRGFQFVFKAFTDSLKYKLKRGLISERPNTFAFGKANGKPLWLHKMRFLLQDRKFTPYIQSVFAMGSDAVEYFNSVYKKWSVFPFSYCTQFLSYNDVPNIIKENARFVFIGGLNWWKSVISILEADNKIFNECKIGGG